MQKDARYRDATLPGATPDEPGHNDTFVWTDILPSTLPTLPNPIVLKSSFTSQLTSQTPATMIAVPDPSIYGLSGGGKIWENPKDFDDKTEAWTVSVMHQIHCLVRTYLRTLTKRLRYTSNLTGGLQDALQEVQGRQFSTQ